MSFSNQLILWYLENQRNLPWRNTKNPYFIWLSEIILQQTRIDQGTSYYLKFCDQFPTINELAKADEDTVLKLWQGLGYYSRARNLLFTAKYITNDLNGQFPNTYNSLLKLKGIGPYTAAAISSICFNEPKACVDGNVFRVLSRYFNIKTPINTTQGLKEFSATAQSLIDENQPGTFNQAVMELGALVCMPKNPNCSSCPIANGCIAYHNDLTKTLPVKINKIKIKKRYFNYLVLNIENSSTIIEQRKNKGIWQQLYQFPLYESQNEADYKDVINSNTFEKLINEKSYTIKRFNKNPIIHKLTHQHIHTNFWIIDSETKKTNAIDWNIISNFAVPTLINNFIENYRK